jgi:hypothetical protein
MGTQVHGKVTLGLGRRYLNEWFPTEWYCPACGHQSVWEEADQGDYYMGVDFMCTHCGVTFYLPSEPAGPNEYQQTVLAALRKAGGSKP